MYSDFRERNASLVKAYESMQDRKWSISYTDRAGNRRSVTATDEADAKKLAQEFKGKGMQSVSVVAASVNEEYIEEAQKINAKQFKEAATRNLEGDSLATALTSTCMSHWYDLISTFVTRTDVYDVHPIIKKNGFKILRMTPGHDVKDQAYESIVKSSTSLANALNKLFGKDVFEPRVQRAEGTLETLVAFRDSPGGVFQCKAKVTGGDTEIFLTIPEEAELDTAFKSMLGLASGMDSSLEGPDSTSPVAGDPAPEYDPSDDIEPNTDIDSIDIPNEAPELDLEDDEGDFRNLPAHPDQRIERYEARINSALRALGSPKLESKLSYDEFVGVGQHVWDCTYELKGRHAHLKRRATVQTKEKNENDAKKIVKQKFPNADIASITCKYNGVRQARGGSTNEAKQPPQEAKAYKNGYITGQESSSGDASKATIPDNYRGTEHEAKWKQGFRDGFKNKPLKEDSPTPAAWRAPSPRSKHWTTTPEENFRKTPVVGSYWRVDEDGSIGIHVVTSVADGVVYSQNTKTREKFDTPLKQWARMSGPHNMKESFDDVYITIDWDGSMRRVKVVRQSADEIHLQDASGEEIMIDPFDDEFNKIKREIESARDSNAWREKNAARRQGRHYHESAEKKTAISEDASDAIKQNRMEAGTTYAGTVIDYREQKNGKKALTVSPDGFERIELPGQIVNTPIAFVFTDKPQKIGSRVSFSIKKKSPKDWVSKQTTSESGPRDEMGTYMGPNVKLTNHWTLYQRIDKMSVAESAAGATATNSVGASKDAGHATAHAPDAVGVKKLLRRKKKNENDTK